MKKTQLFSGIYSLPAGKASDEITAGCMVLEGGAFRGVYTSGVLDALMENGINLQCTVGVSAGAMNGMNYVSGQIGRSARVNLRYRHDSRYVGLHAIRRNHGLIGFDFVFGHMDNVPEFDLQRFSDKRRQFYAVATNLSTGQPEYFEKDSGASIYQAIRASASMPYISQPVTIRRQKYLDGGCSVNIPYQWAIQQGYKKIVAVKTQHTAFRKTIKEPDEHARAKEDVYRSVYPAFADALRESDARYNRECDELEQLGHTGRIFVIAPSEPVTVGRLEPDMEKLGGLYELGYRDGQQQIDALKAYLKGETAT